MTKPFVAINEREIMSRSQYLNAIIDKFLQSDDTAICLLEDVNGGEINSENLNKIYSTLYILAKKKPVILVRRNNKLFLVKERA